MIDETIHTLEIELLQATTNKVPMQRDGIIVHVPYCDIYKCSRVQRISEIGRDVGLKGTMGYEKKGCYDCIGFKMQCMDDGSYSTYLK